MELQETAHLTMSGTVLDEYMLLIFFIMVIAGSLGGLANYLLTENHFGFTWKGLIKYAVLGIVAALMTPLLLNMVSSDLLALARTAPLDLFVFGGLCLVFVLSSRRIFEAVAQKLMQQIGQSARGAFVAARATDFSGSELSQSDMDIMRAVAQGGSVYENFAAIAPDAPLSKEFVNERLALLKRVGLVELKMNEKNVLHMHLSQQGRQLLAEFQ